ncbi:putative histone acetyltransferase chromatin regulator PHD family [Helianthus debilis subsp. tardiflorus]
MRMKEIEGSERSGSLIVEKKVSYGVGGVLGFSDGSSRKLFNLNKEKKRSRVVVSDSESSDELGEPVRRKVYKLGTGLVENEEFLTRKKVDDDSDERRIRKDVGERRKLMLHRQNGNRRESGSGSSKTSFDKKVDSYSNKKSANSSMYAKEHDGLNLSLSVSNGNEEDDLDGSHRTVGMQEKNGARKERKEFRTGIQTTGTMKMVKKDASVKARMKNVSSVNNKESKIQRASYTEKQLLREKIKNMLFGAGWTIDYRPRRGRDYLDSVYISPTGNAYWSITKAYDALKKEEKNGSKDGGDFTPLPNEILSKLTRQTRKKIEKEIDGNRKNEGNSKKSKRAKVKKLAQDKAIKLLERRPELESCEFDKETPRKHGLKKSTIRTSSHMVQGERNRTMGRLTLLVRGYDTVLNSEDNGLDSHSGKVGKRTLLSWLTDSGMVSVGDKVEYMNLRKTRVMQEGWITEDGIHCDCCSKIITISRFELHAGSKLGKPFQNMFIKSGNKSLMQCLIDGWNKQEESERKGFHAVDVDGDDPNDDTCGKCGDGGDLICCDGCPSTFHLSCLDMQMLPQGDWHCPNCACKYCERVGRHSTKASGRTGNSLLTCRLCEKKYHKSCSPETDDITIDSDDLNIPFCEQKCRELYNRLQKLLWVKHELDSGFSWYLIHRSDPLPDVSSVNFSQRVESNSKLAVALSVMDECFLPIIDSRSGISLIHNVVYNCGSNFSRLNYSGFFTAILDKGDEMICAASIRIHGTQLAEMPFIGTRHSYRRQGMCRRLLNAIESALSSLKVEKLVIPAIEEHLHTWTHAFGFSPLEKSQKQEMRSINMLVFPGTDMLHKTLMNEGTSRGSITSDKGEKGVEVDDYNKALESELNNAAKPTVDSSTGNPSGCEIRSFGKKSDEQSDPNILKGAILDTTEIAEGTGGADSASKVEANDLQKGNGMDIGITNASLPQVPARAAHDTILTEVTANDSDSINVHSDSVVIRNDNVNELESGTQFPGKEAASVDARDASNKNA